MYSLQILSFLLVKGVRHLKLSYTPLPMNTDVDLLLGVGGEFMNGSASCLMA